MMENAVAALTADFKKQMERCESCDDQCNDCRWEHYCIHVKEWENKRKAIK